MNKEEIIFMNGFSTHIKDWKGNNKFQLSLETSPRHILIDTAKNFNTVKEAKEYYLKYLKIVLIETLKKLKLEENKKGLPSSVIIPHMTISKEDLEQFNLEPPITQELLNDTAEMMSNFIMQDWNNDLLQAVNEAIANKREK